MSKVVKRIISLCLVVVMVMGVMVGCGSTNNTSTDSSTVSTGAATTTNQNSALDTSEQVELAMWMTGSKGPTDLQLVVDEINKLALKDLNCTVKYNIFNTPDTQQKYVLLLASGEPIDLMYSASYINYPQNSKKGAFMALDELGPKYAPKLWAYEGEDILNAAKVEGKIYMIPSAWKEYVPSGFMYREDLRLKYNLPEVKDLDTMEQYLVGIKKNETSMPSPTVEGVTSVGSLGSYFMAWESLDSKYQWIDWRMPYGLNANYSKPGELYNYWESEDFRTDMKLFKKWADLGFWSKSALSSKDDPQLSFINGKTAASIGGNINPGKYADTVDKVSAAHPDWKVGFLPYFRPKQLANANHPTQNGMSVPITAKNPERVLAFYEKLVTEKAYYDLSQYGILDKHYKVTEAGNYETIGDPSKSGFQREAMRGWAWRNESLQIYPKTFQLQKELFKEFETYEKPNIYTGFAEDSTAYQSERAALMNVLTQYLTPIEGGMMTDVDKAIDEFLAKAKVAGLEKIQKEFTVQWKDYITKSGLDK